VENIIQLYSQSDHSWQYNTALCLATWIITATNTHSEYAILIALVRQQCFRKGASMLLLNVYCMSCLAFEGAAFLLQNTSTAPQLKKFLIFQETRKYSCVKDNPSLKHTPTFLIIAYIYFPNLIISSSLRISDRSKLFVSRLPIKFFWTFLVLPTSICRLVHLSLFSSIYLYNSW